MIELRLNPLDPEKDLECLYRRSVSVQQHQTGTGTSAWPELTVDQVRILVRCNRRAADEPEREPWPRLVV